MKRYFIFYLDYKNNDKVILKESHSTTQDAQCNLEFVALDHIKKYQGEQQVLICKQYEKSPDQILNDSILKEGMYVRRENDKLVLYEKVNELIPGTFWNSYILKVNKIGIFDIASYEIELNNNVNTCKYISTHVDNKLIDNKDIVGKKSYIGELHKLFENKIENDNQPFGTIFKIIKDKNKENNKKNIRKNIDYKIGSEVQVCMNSVNNAADETLKLVHEQVKKTMNNLQDLQLSS